MCTSKLYPSENTFNHVSNGLGLTPTICKECQKVAFPQQSVISKGAWTILVRFLWHILS